MSRKAIYLKQKTKYYFESFQNREKKRLLTLFTPEFLF